MNHKNIHEDQRYIIGLRENDSKIINEIYKKFTPKVIQFIKQNSGGIDQANDVVQDVLIVLYDQAKTESLELTCPFDAYFFLLCKRKWLNELQKKSNKAVTIPEDFVSIDNSTIEMADETEKQASKERLFLEHFEKLPAACKNLLQLCFSIKSMEEVAEKLNVSYAYARKKKSECMSQITKWVQETDLYKTLKN